MTVATGRRIVVIEDEDEIRDVLAYNLERAGFSVSCAANGRTGLELVRSERPELVLLDLMLPEVDGLDVCRALRADEATATLPVIMLTARDDESDVVLGLGVGADDYVTKPFSPREVVARVEAMLRRSARVSTPAGATDEATDDVDASLAEDPDRRRVSSGAVVVDPDRHEVLVDGESIRFTRTELRLLHVLLRRPGRVYTREQLVERVMGDNAWITDRTIDVHVRAIRRKLGDHGEVVETIRGVGYRGRDDGATS
jgi:two-component system phosphate regulon response regulator PhoB